MCPQLIGIIGFGRLKARHEEEFVLKQIGNELVVV